MTILSLALCLQLPIANELRKVFVFDGNGFG